MKSKGEETGVDLKHIKIKDSFWSKYQEAVMDKALPYQWDAINDRIPGAEPSRAIRNFKIAAGLEKGEHYGFTFQDTDLAKWLETASYSLALRPDAELDRRADEAIDLIGRAQDPDGYLNTYFTIKEPGKRFTNLHEAHELYCAGHFMEAAVAHRQATGKESMLKIACRLADLLDRTFGPEPGKSKGYCGHPEIELALVRLYNETREERYLKLAAHFVDERGREPYYFAKEKETRKGSSVWNDFAGFDRRYIQTHLPVRQQESAEGHAVRLVYLFTAAADIARLTGDGELRAACGRIWDSIVSRRMYVTGGIGSTKSGEAFTCDYDLPNDTVYAETCASVGMVFFANRMLEMEKDGRYADLMERELYNGALSGISLDGTKYFYVNPLSVWPLGSAENPELRHVKPVRQAWYACACCPSNITRLILSLGKYVYSAGEEGVYVHLYLGSEAELSAGGSTIRIRQETGYPYEGGIRLKVRSSGGKGVPLFLRIPLWCEQYSCRVDGKEISSGALEKGYLRIDSDWSGEKTVELSLEMQVRLVRSNPKLRDNAGKAAIMRGPLVYCLEEADNGPCLNDLSITEDPEWSARFEPGLLGGTVAIRGRGSRTDEAGWPGDSLYSHEKPGEKPVEILAVPYALWCNRAPGEMRVWIHEG